MAKRNLHQTGNQYTGWHLESVTNGRVVKKWDVSSREELVKLRNQWREWASHQK